MKVEDIQPKRRGQAVLADEFNALLAAAKERAPSRTQMPVGVQLPDLSAEGHEVGWREVKLTAYSEEEVPPYSVFGITGPTEETDPEHDVTIAQVSLSGSPLKLYTNGEAVIPAGGAGRIRPVNAFRATKVRVSTDGTSPTPVVGWACGVQPGQYGVTRDRLGLMCIGLLPEEDSEVGVTYALVVPAFEPCAMLCQVTERITPFSTSTLTLGRGRGAILERFDFDTDMLYSALDPSDGSAPWVAEIFSIAEKAWEVGDIVRCVGTVGVGLVVDMPPGTDEEPETSASSSSSGPPAELIHFTCAQDVALSTDKFHANLTRAYQGHAPDEDEELTIWNYPDPTGAVGEPYLFQAPSGYPGKASWDDKRQHYWVDWIKCSPRKIPTQSPGQSMSMPHSVTGDYQPPDAESPDPYVPDTTVPI